MADLDPPGTCHLVSCAGKGVHLVTEPHSLPSDPPDAKADIYKHTVEPAGASDVVMQVFAEGARQARERMSALPGAPIANKVYPKIGTPDSWAPYEGGPTIPKPSHDRCLGFPVIQMTETGALAYCSIQAGAWSTRMLREAKYNAGALVDEHNRTCPNRRAR